MPTNLNALIRYKTINSCLYGGRRRWSIDELREKCSEALAESRGRYTPVSERTIRDDIRVMRSNILGFNAPIEQKGGLYYYSDPEYSILSIHITDAGLAEKILTLLMTLREIVNHPEMEIIVAKLCAMLHREYQPVYAKRDRINLSKKAICTEEMPDLYKDVTYDMKSPSKRTAALPSGISKFKVRAYELLWGEILAAVSKI